MQAILERGAQESYDGLPIIELRLLDLVIEDPSEHDGLIDKYGDPERIAWMNQNYNDRATVDELGGAASYATRLYDYEGSGKDQVAWATEKLRADRGARSAIITALQPLSDTTTYIPCVSQLQFWIPADSLELIAIAHSIDFGTKGYANLVELAAIQLRMSSSLGVPLGPMLLRATSAHLYDTDLGALRATYASWRAQIDARD